MHGASFNGDQINKIIKKFMENESNFNQLLLANRIIIE